jgi:predicted ATPase/DNA-binding SARP family transcriptional activator
MNFATNGLTSSLTIQLFGPYDVRQNGALIPRTRTRTEQWLLALLVLKHDRPLDRIWLASTLWPDSTESQALNNLRRSLSNLRYVLGSDSTRLICSSPQRVSFDTAGAVVDVLAFDAAIALGDAVSMAKAVELYRGPLLEGCVEEWVLQERQSREDAYVEALQQLAAAALEQCDYLAAIAHLRRGIAVDPLHETLQRRLMEALAANGDYATMTQVYREFRLYLSHELQSMPSGETVALYERLRMQGCQRAATERKPPISVVSPPPPRMFPSPLTTLIGREIETRKVMAALDKTRLVTLTGIGGVGKTRLAIEVARESADRYADGVWFVELAALSDPGMVPQTIASALGVQEQTNPSILKKLVDFLQSKNLLLVMDNCEHLLPVCAQLTEDLLEACHEITILATSREKLGIHGERIYYVPCLSVPDLNASCLEALASCESVRLFLDRAALSRSDFGLTPDNAPIIAQLCNQLEGIPLALELAAARIGTISVEQIIERLDNRFAVLTTGSRTASLRQRTLQATLDWSYDLLPRQEQMLLRRLAVFGGGWSLQAAEIVCAGEGIEEAAILDLMYALVNKSLVIYRQSQGQARHHLLETVREYAWDRLQAENESHRICRRHRDYFLRLVEEAQPHLYGAEQISWLGCLETEHDNIRTALKWCRNDPEGAEAALRLTGALQRFWRDRGYLTEGRQHYQAALTHEHALARTSARASALIGAGSLAEPQGDFEQAYTLYEESLAISQELGDEHSIAIALGKMGGVAHAQGNYEVAFPLLEQSLALNRALGNAWYIGQITIILGNIAMDQGDLERARVCYEQCLATWRALGDRRYAFALDNLGILTAKQGDYRLAYALHQESLAITQEFGDRRGMAISFFHLGLVAQKLGDMTAAFEFLKRSLAYHRELGDKDRIAEVLIGIEELQKLQMDKQGTATSDSSYLR